MFFIMGKYDLDTREFTQSPPDYVGIGGWRDEPCGVDELVGPFDETERVLCSYDNRCIEESSNEGKRGSLITNLGKQGLLAE